MWVASGMPHEVFWDLTEREIEAALRCRTDRDRAANLRAGLVASAIYNVHRKKGSRVVKPSDFLKQPARYMSPKEAATFMDRWARGVNRAAAEERRAEGADA